MKTKITLVLSLVFAMILQAQKTEFKGLEALQMLQKTVCNTLEEGKPVYGMWEGRMYSRVEGEKDKHIFNVVGINVRQCDCVDDDVKGQGFRSVGREIMMYLDPETNEILDTWENPWTGESVEVLHVANDPVSLRSYIYEKDDKGEDRATFSFRKYGDVAVTSYEYPLFYNNPLAGDYQNAVGGKYHAMEIFNTYYLTEELTNPKIRDLKTSNISWSRIAQWLPWMNMAGKQGIMVVNSTGESVLDKDKIWPRIQTILKDRYPLYMNPPAKDDKRPNETSWTVYKKHIAAKAKMAEESKEK